MKKNAQSLLLFSMISSALSSAPALALVREVASCTTMDGRYEVLVLDNQGIGPVRPTHLTASIRDTRTDEVVASFGQVETTFVHSISFGRKQWIDSATGGSSFNLAGPSTNDREVLLSATLAFGDTLDERNLTCPVFDGVVQ